MKACTRCKLSARCLSESRKDWVIHDAIQVQMVEEESNKGTYEDFRKYVRGLERSVLESLPRNCPAVREYGT